MKMGQFNFYEVFAPQMMCVTHHRFSQIFENAEVRFCAHAHKIAPNAWGAGAHHHRFHR